MRLQGINTNLCYDGISERKLEGLIGNALTQSVAGRVMIKLLEASKLTGKLRDPWLARLALLWVHCSNLRLPKISQTS